MTHDEGATGRVGYFRRPEPEYAGDSLHEACGGRWHDHGWIDSGPEGETLCPGGSWQIGDLMQYRDSAWRLLAPAVDQPAGPQQGPAIMRYFDFTHLTNPSLQAVSSEFAQLAQYVVDHLPAGPEQSVSLRKLLEAKDAAVRAALDGMPNRGLVAAEGRQVLGVLREPRVGEACCGGAQPEPGVFRTGGGCCRDEQQAGADEEGTSNG